MARCAGGGLAELGVRKSRRAARAVALDPRRRRSGGLCADEDGAALRAARQYHPLQWRGTRARSGRNPVRNGEGPRGAQKLAAHSVARRCADAAAVGGGREPCWFFERRSLAAARRRARRSRGRSEEHTSELQSLMRISYAVF